MKLSDVVRGIDIIDRYGNMEVDIKDIVYDSRKVSAGCVFVCVTGFKVDGHQYLEDAIKKGAVAAIIEKDVDVKGIALVKVADTRKSMSILGSNFYNHPTDTLKLIGITGTNGKTTTTYLIKSIFDHAHKKTSTIGTISIRIGDVEVPSSRTTPESVDLQQLFREMLDKDMEYSVMEVSSHALDLGRVDNCSFKVGIFTNLTQDHLDYHKNFDNYREAKKKLFYKTTHTNIINIDDMHGRMIANEIKDLKAELITYGIDSNADIMAKNIIMDIKGIKFTLVTPKYSIDLEYKTPGRFSVYNCLAAAAVAYSEGIDKTIIKEGLIDIESVPGRSEVVNIDKPYSVIIDYAHSPDSLENILNAVRQYTKGRLITVFGCGGDRETQKRPIMGEVAGRLSDYCVVTSDNPRSEEPDSIIKQIEQGISNTKCDYICIENRRAAIEHALKIAKQDDVVLLAGKGHETYQELKTGTIHFDEREVIRELIREEV
ncbi:MAG: UDP-N-acetylmuramoyl-L-alanyl-D-glutamate--2,6-diaminopimelate ligase [Clostridia bacterium]|jgi:UDP-N-acetylmuramoyl-L-alanyl-D-glutamate--2,6-diaminopimelate ligase|nr:UDP-N-acetylmuramoyl-L-alanyl-D-glutamate--2,6-diaminopimelate ligase [Clostridia bacterium]